MSPNPIYKRQLAMFEALRKLGFVADDIFVMFNHGRPLTILRTQGKQFAVDYPAPEPAIPDSETYVREWTAAADEWNTQMGEAERSTIYEEHFLCTGGSVLVMALLERGFVFPKAVN